MTKIEYMDSLKEALKGFDPEICEEIVADYEEHFTVGAANGKTEEQVIEELGTVEQLVTELKNLSGDKADKSLKDKATEFIKSNTEFLRNNEEAAKTFDDIMKSFAGFLGSVAATVTNGTEKFTVDFTENAENFASSFANGVENAADKVVSKSTSFAKEVANSYKSNRNTPEESTEKSEDVSESPADAAPEVETADAVEATKVFIETDCGDINVSKSSDNEVHINYENAGTANQQLAYKFTMNQENDTVYASAKKQFSASNFFTTMTTPAITLTVELPESVKELNIHTASGDVEIEAVDLTDLSIITASGDVTLNNVKADNTEVTSVSGDLSLDNLSALNTTVKTVSGDIFEAGEGEKVRVSTVSGDVELKLTNEKSINVSSTSGDVKVDLPGVSGYNASVKSISGAINLAYAGNTRSSVRSGNYFFGEGDIDVTVSTTSGDIEINA